MFNHQLGDLSVCRWVLGKGRAVGIRGLKNLFNGLAARARSGQIFNGGRGKGPGQMGRWGFSGFVSCWRVELNMCQKDQLKDLLPNSVQVELVLWELPSPRSLALKRQRHVLGVDKTLGTVKAERRQLLSL